MLLSFSSEANSSSRTFKESNSRSALSDEVNRLELSDLVGVTVRKSRSST
jgi:hypothetical protein